MVVKAPEVQGSEAPPVEDLELAGSDKEAVVPEGSDTTDDSDIDYKAKYQESEAKLLKREADLNSLRGARLKQDERDDAIISLGERMDGWEKSNQALLKALAKGDSEELPEELARIEAEGASTRAQRQFAKTHEDLLNDLRKACKSEDGEDMLDPDTAPELENVRLIWYQAIKDREVTGFHRALAETHTVVKAEERRLHKVALADARKAERDAKEKLDDAELGDTSINGRPGSPGNGTGDTLLKMTEGLEKRRKAGTWK